MRFPTVTPVIIRNCLQQGIFFLWRAFGIKHIHFFLTLSGNLKRYNAAEKVRLKWPNLDTGIPWNAEHGKIFSIINSFKCIDKRTTHQSNASGIRADKWIGVEFPHWHVDLTGDDITEISTAVNHPVSFLVYKDRIQFLTICKNLHMMAPGRETDCQGKAAIRCFGAHMIGEFSIPRIIAFQCDRAASGKRKVCTAADEQMGVERSFIAGPGIGSDGSNQSCQIRRTAGTVIPADSLRCVFFCSISVSSGAGIRVSLQLVDIEELFAIQLHTA